MRTIDIATGKALRSHPAPDVDILFAAGGTRALVQSRGGSLQLLDGDGANLWPQLPGRAEIEAAALSLGLLTTIEDRSGADSRIHAYGWYRQHARHFTAPGYRAEVVALSPSGRHGAAIVSSEGRIWAIHAGTEETFPAANGSGFPDALAFDGERVLRLGFERPASAWSARYPFDSWRQDTPPGALDGFYGTALSSTGTLVARDDDRELGLVNTGAILFDRPVGPYAFSADGSVLVVADGKKLVSFDASGKRLGEHALPCAPGALAADRAGEVIALLCDRELATFGAGATVKKRAIGEAEGVRIAPDGHLIAVQRETAVDLFTAADLELAATITVRDAEALATTPDGAVMFWNDASSWKAATACRIGQRGYPFEVCEDKLMVVVAVDRRSPMCCLDRPRAPPWHGRRTRQGRAPTGCREVVP